MLRDVWTIMLKEWKEHLFQRDVLRGNALRLLFLVAFIGVIVPLRFGPQWVEAPIVMIAALWVAIFVVIGVTPDSFAGERERHTIETLLASRLADSAILLGKIGATVGYVSGVTLIGLIVGLVTLNLFQAAGEVVLYKPAVFLGAAALSLLGAFFGAVVGAMISIRAATVQQAYQNLRILLVLLLVGPIILMQTLPDKWRERLVEWMSAAESFNMALIGILLFTVLDVFLFLVALTRFKRDRLILH